MLSQGLKQKQAWSLLLDVFDFKFIKTVFFKKNHFLTLLKRYLTLNKFLKFIVFTLLLCIEQSKTLEIVMASLFDNCLSCLSESSRMNLDIFETFVVITNSFRQNRVVTVIFGVFFLCTNICSFARTKPRTEK